MNCYRSSYEELYDLMLADAQNAIDKLPVEPYPVKEVGRATLKAAYGLLARIALTRVAYSDNQTDKDKYYTIAEDAAQYVIDNQDELKVFYMIHPLKSLIRIIIRLIRKLCLW